MNQQQQRRDAVLAAASSALENLARMEPRTVYGPSAYLDLGFPAEFVAACGGKHGGGDYWKDWIDGDPEKVVEGVLHLDFVEAVNRTLGVWPQRSFFGRGSQFRAEMQVLREALAKAEA